MEFKMEDFEYLASKQCYKLLLEKVEPLNCNFQYLKQTPKYAKLFGFFLQELLQLCAHKATQQLVLFQPECEQGQMAHEEAVSRLTEKVRSNQEQAVRKVKLAEREADLNYKISLLRDKIRSEQHYESSLLFLKDKLSSLLTLQQGAATTQPIPDESFLWGEALFLSLMTNVILKFPHSAKRFLINLAVFECNKQGLKVILEPESEFFVPLAPAQAGDSPLKSAYQKHERRRVGKNIGQDQGVVTATLKRYLFSYEENLKLCKSLPALPEELSLMMALSQFKQASKTIVPVPVIFDPAELGFKFLRNSLDRYKVLNDGRSILIYRILVNDQLKSFMQAESAADKAKQATISPGTNATSGLNQNSSLAHLPKRAKKCIQNGWTLVLKDIDSSSLRMIEPLITWCYNRFQHATRHQGDPKSYKLKNYEGRQSSDFNNQLRVTSQEIMYLHPKFRMFLFFTKRSAIQHIDPSILQKLSYFSFDLTPPSESSIIRNPMQTSPTTKESQAKQENKPKDQGGAPSLFQQLLKRKATTVIDDLEEVFTGAATPTQSQNTMNSNLIRLYLLNIIRKHTDAEFYSHQKQISRHQYELLIKRKHERRKVNLFIKAEWNTNLSLSNDEEEKRFIRSTRKQLQRLGTGLLLQSLDSPASSPKGRRREKIRDAANFLNEESQLNSEEERALDQSLVDGGEEESMTERFEGSSERKQLVRKRSSVVKRDQLIEESNRETGKLLRKQSSFSPSMVKRLKTKDQEEDGRHKNTTKRADKSNSRSPENQNTLLKRSTTNIQDGIKSAKASRASSSNIIKGNFATNAYSRLIKPQQPSGVSSDKTSLQNEQVQRAQVEEEKKDKVVDEESEISHSFSQIDEDSKEKIDDQETPLINAKLPPSQADTKNAKSKFTQLKPRTRAEFNKDLDVVSKQRHDADEDGGPQDFRLLLIQQNNDFTQSSGHLSSERSDRVDGEGSQEIKSKFNPQEYQDLLATTKVIFFTLKKLQKVIGNLYGYNMLHFIKVLRQAIAVSQKLCSNDKELQSMIIRKLIQRVQQSLSQEHLQIFNFTLSVELYAKLVYDQRKEGLVRQLSFMLKNATAVDRQLKRRRQTLAQSSNQQDIQSLIASLRFINNNSISQHIWAPPMYTKHALFIDQYELLEYLQANGVLSSSADAHELKHNEDRLLSDELNMIVDQDHHGKPTKEGESGALKLVFLEKLQKATNLAAKSESRQLLIGLGSKLLRLRKHVAQQHQAMLQMVEQQQQMYLEQQKPEETKKTLPDSSNPMAGLFKAMKSSPNSNQSKPLFGSPSKEKPTANAGGGLLGALSSSINMQQLISVHLIQNISTKAQVQQLKSQKPWFIQKQNWDLLLKLVQTFPHSYQGLIKAINDDQKKWSRFLLELNPIYSTEDKAAEFEFPGDWNTYLKPMEKLLVIYCLKPEVLVQAASFMLSSILDQSLVKDTDIFDTLNEIIQPKSTSQKGQEKARNQPVLLFYEHQSFSPSKFITSIGAQHQQEILSFDAKGFLEAYLASKLQAKKEHQYQQLQSPDVFSSSVQMPVQAPIVNFRGSEKTVSQYNISQQSHLDDARTGQLPQKRSSASNLPQLQKQVDMQKLKGLLQFDFSQSLQSINYQLLMANQLKESKNEQIKIENQGSRSPSPSRKEGALNVQERNSIYKPALPFRTETSGVTPNCRLANLKNEGLQSPSFGKMASRQLTSAAFNSNQQTYSSGNFKSILNVHSLLQNPSLLTQENKIIFIENINELSDKDQLLLTQIIMDLTTRDEEMRLQHKHEHRVHTRIKQIEEIRDSKKEKEQQAYRLKRHEERQLKALEDKERRYRQRLGIKQDPKKSSQSKVSDANLDLQEPEMLRKLSNALKNSLTFKHQASRLQQPPARQAQHSLKVIDKQLLRQQIQEEAQKRQADQQRCKMNMAAQQDQISTKQSKLKIFMSYKVPTADNSRMFEPLRVSKQDALQFLIMNSQVIYLNSPQNVKGFMERMYQEEVAQVKINAQSQSSQQLTFGSQVINLQPPNLSSLQSTQSNFQNQNMRRSVLPSIGGFGQGAQDQSEGQLKIGNKRMMFASPSNRESNMSGVVQNQALQHIYKMQMLKEQNFPQSMLLQAGEKYAKLIRDHMRDFEKNQSRTKFILNFICALQLLKKNALKHTDTAKYFLNRHKLMSMTTFATLVEQSMDLTFKCLFASNQHQSLFFLNQLESQLSSLDEDMLIRYDSHSAIKQIFKALYANTCNSFANPTPWNTIQLANSSSKQSYHFPLRDKTYTAQELSEILFSMPNQDPNSLRGSSVNQELIFGWQRTKSFMQVIGHLYNEDKFARDWGVDLREDRRIKSEIAAAAAARREKKGQEKDRKKYQVAAISALLSGLGKASISEQDAALAKNETQVYQQTQTYLTRAVRNLQSTFTKLIHERKAIASTKIPDNSMDPTQPSAQELIRRVLDEEDDEEKPQLLKTLIQLQEKQMDNERREQRKQVKRLKVEKRKERRKQQKEANKKRKEQKKQSQSSSDQDQNQRGAGNVNEKDLKVQEEYKERLRELGIGVSNLIQSVSNSSKVQNQAESSEFSHKLQTSSFEDKTSIDILKVIEIAQSLLRIIDNPHFDFKIYADNQQAQAVPYKHSYYPPNPQGIPLAPRKFGRQSTTRPRSSKGKNQMLNSAEIDLKLGNPQGQVSTSKNQPGLRFQGGNSPHKEFSLIDDDYFAGYRIAKSLSPLKREETSGSRTNTTNPLDPLTELLQMPKNGTALEGRRTFATRTRPTKFSLQPVINTEAIRRNLLKNQSSQLSQGSNSSNTLQTPSSNLNVLENFSSAHQSGLDNPKPKVNSAANKRKQFARFVGSQEFRTKGPALVPSQRDSDLTLEESNSKSVESGLKLSIHKESGGGVQQQYRKLTDAESIEAFNDIKRAQSIAAQEEDNIEVFHQDELPNPLDALRIDRNGERQRNEMTTSQPNRLDQRKNLMKRNVLSAEDHLYNPKQLIEKDAATPNLQEGRDSKRSQDNKSYGKDNYPNSLNQQANQYLAALNSKNEYSPSEFSSSNQSPLLPQEPVSGSSLGNQNIQNQRPIRGFSHNLSPISKLLKPAQPLSRPGSNEQHQSSAVIDLLIAKAAENSMDYEEGEGDSQRPGLDSEEVEARKNAAQKARRSKEEHIQQPLLKKHTSVDPKIMSRVTGTSDQLLDESQEFGEQSLQEINDPNSPSVAGGAIGSAIGKKGDKMKIETQNDIIHEESFESSQNSRGGHSKSSKLKFQHSPDDIRDDSLNENQEEKDKSQISEDGSNEDNHREGLQDNIEVENLYLQNKRSSHGGAHYKQRVQVTLEQIYLSKTIVEHQIEKEVAIVRNLFGMIKHDIFGLLDYIRGSRFQWLNHSLVNLFNCLLTNRVPSQWLSCGFSVVNLQLSLSEWIECLVVKLSYLSGLCKNQKNEQYQFIDLSRLLQPSFILNQMIFRYLYQSRFISNFAALSAFSNLESFEIRAEILDRKITPIEMQKYLLKLKSDNSLRINARRPSNIKDAKFSSNSDISTAPFLQLLRNPSSNQGLFGYCKNSLDSIVLHQVFVTGIKLMNARVDLTNGFLEDAKTRVYEYQLPAMCIYIQQKQKEEQNLSKYSSDFGRGLDITVTARQIPVAPTSKGYYYFENAEDHEELFLQTNSDQAHIKETYESQERLSPSLSGQNHPHNPSRQAENFSRARPQVSINRSQFDPSGNNNFNKQPQLLMKASTATRLQYLKEKKGMRSKSESTSNMQNNLLRLIQTSSSEIKQLIPQNNRTSSQQIETFTLGSSSNLRPRGDKLQLQTQKPAKQTGGLITNSIKLTKLDDKINHDKGFEMNEKHRGRNLTQGNQFRGKSLNVHTGPSLFHVSPEEEQKIEALMEQNQEPYSETNKGWRSRYTSKLNKFVKESNHRSMSQQHNAMTGQGIESSTPTQVLGAGSSDKMAIDKRKYLVKTKGSDSQRSESDSKRNRDELNSVNQMQASQFSQQRQNNAGKAPDQIEANINNTQSIVPFKRRDDKVFEVRIPLIIDFMVNARTSAFYEGNKISGDSSNHLNTANMSKQQDNSKSAQFSHSTHGVRDLSNGLGCLGEQFKYSLVFHSHFNQGYWDSIGAYAICDPKSGV